MKISGAGSASGGRYLPLSKNLLKNPYQMQGGRRFSYNKVNFHPEIRIYWFFPEQCYYLIKVYILNNKSFKGTRRLS